LIHFSVLTRVHKRPKSLKIALDSILKQTHKNISVLCSIDTEDDSSIDIISNFKQEGLDITLYKTQALGYPKCNLYLNSLCSKVRLDSWIHILDDDDKYIDYSVFSTLASIIEIHKPSAIVNKVEVELNGKIVHSPIPPFWKKRPTLHNFGSSNMVFPQNMSQYAKFNGTQYGDYEGLLHLFSNLEQKEIYWLDMPIIKVKASFGKEENE
jgi:hypothetical protein